MPGLQNKYKVQNTRIRGTPEEEERATGKEELSETIVTENSPQIDGRHQSQSREAWETLIRIHANKTRNILYLRHISSSNYRKSKIKKF